MIEFVSGNIFNCDAEALVNPVNTAGVMGKGLAKQFRERFPEIMEPYREACDSGEFKTGMVFTVQVAENQSPKYIINFPTKRHWRSKSKLEYIESGLKALVEEVQRLKINSIAIPPLGCGLGGLQWEEVKPRIVDAFNEINKVLVYVIEPD